jgi:hypothetical protein
MIASRGFHSLCTHKISNPESESRRLPSTYPINAGESIYIHTTALEGFVSELLPKIQVPFVLVSGDTDRTVPDDCQKACAQILGNQFLINWFAQNCTKTDNPKLVQLPIGLDFHTLANRKHWWGPQQTIEEQTSSVEKLRNLQVKKRPICYGNFQFLMNTRYANDRRNAIAEVNRELVYYEPRPIPRLESWNNMIQHKYVISPHGNGLDCHRTWEALALGCIPIVRTSSLDPMFNGLPVLIVKEWSDVTAEVLDSFVPDYSCVDKLKINYWNTIINGKLVPK